MNEPLVCVSFEAVTVEEALEEAARANLAGADSVSYTHLTLPTNREV